MSKLTDTVCPVDCVCAGCECPVCGEDDFVLRDPSDVLMEEILKPMFNFYRCRKCDHQWGVYK